jgi:aryl-alcohol dehydrogenase-like predicted oxidoreductase
MDYVNLGKTGLKVSRICLGCMTYGAPATGALRPGSHAWALNEKESQPFFRQALDLGINFFDTANVYSGGASEEVLGRFLKANTRREAVVVATKVHGVMRDEPNGRASPGKPFFMSLTRASAGWEPTTSTSIRFIAGITKRRSRRPWRPCTTW